MAGCGGARLSYDRWTLELGEQHESWQWRWLLRPLLAGTGGLEYGQRALLDWGGASDWYNVDYWPTVIAPSGYQMTAFSAFKNKVTASPYIPANRSLARHLTNARFQGQ